MKKHVLYCLYDTKTRGGICVFCGTIAELEKYTGRNAASLRSAKSHGHLIQRRFELQSVKI